jgi:hypothetical protein
MKQAARKQTKQFYIPEDKTLRNPGLRTADQTISEISFRFVI